MRNEKMFFLSLLLLTPPRKKAFFPSQNIFSANSKGIQLTAPHLKESTTEQHLGRDAMQAKLMSSSDALFMHFLPFPFLISLFSCNGPTFFLDQQSVTLVPLYSNTAAKALLFCFFFFSEWTRLNPQGQKREGRHIPEKRKKERVLSFFSSSSPIAFYSPTIKALLKKRKRESYPILSKTDLHFFLTGPMIFSSGEIFHARRRKKRKSPFAYCRVESLPSTVQSRLFSWQTDHFVVCWSSFVLLEENLFLAVLAWLGLVTARQAILCRNFAGKKSLLVWSGMQMKEA